MNFGDTKKFGADGARIGAVYSEA